ncbi:MAG TPA: SRPBCC family protein [Chloroflexia bacterium]|nr:SRPBCC family protein [Chloroflexia bacterium]
MGDISKKTQIKVTPDVVYKYVSDPCNTPNYISAIISVDEGSHDGRPAEGQVWRAEANFMGKRRKINLRIEELHPNRLVRFSIDSDPAANISMRISPSDGDSTQAALEVEVPGVPGILLNGIMGGMLSSDMGRLRAILERET